DRVLRPDVAQSLAFSGSRELGMTYPNSPMGAIALIRQTLLDAGWYVRAWDTHRRSPQSVPQPETNSALAALNEAVAGDEPVFFEATSELEVLRARAIAEEFPVDVWLRGSGEEYRILDVLAGARTPLVLPLNFPEAPSVDSPEKALNADLDDLRHWYLAPENPSRVAAAGLQFALTTDGLSKTSEFLPNLRTAVARGLAQDGALAALTVNPARMLGIDARQGTLERGKLANIVVVDGDLFATGSTIRDVWVSGERYVIDPGAAVDPRGTWTITSTEEPRLNGQLEVSGTLARL